MCFSLLDRRERPRASLRGTTMFIVVWDILFFIKKFYKSKKKYKSTEHGKTGAKSLPWGLVPVEPGSGLELFFIKNFSVPIWQLVYVTCVRLI